MIKNNKLLLAFYTYSLFYWFAFVLLGFRSGAAKEIFVAAILALALHIQIFLFSNGKEFYLGFATIKKGDDQGIRWLMSSLMIFVQLIILFQIS